MERCGVSGGYGWLGFHIVDLLVSKGKHVVIFDIAGMQKKKKNETNKKNLFCLFYCFNKKMVQHQ